MTGQVRRAAAAGPPWRARLRVAWTLTSLAVAQIAICAVAAFPIVLAWRQVWPLAPTGIWLQAAALSVLLPASYGVFAIVLMIASAGATKLLGWRTPGDVALRIADLDWPLLHWVRYVSSIRVVNVLAGTLYCGSPVWAFYLRLNGARVGRRVYVNSLDVSDHNLLEFADDVVIGAGVHLSGHTVEGGVVKTGRVRLERGVTIGLGSIVEIDVEAGPGCQVGALSFVPKHARLDAGAVYVGVPVRRVPRDSARAESAAAAAGIE